MMVDLMRRETRAKGSAMKRLALIALSTCLCVALARTAGAQEPPAPEAPAVAVPAEPVPARPAPAAPESDATAPATEGEAPAATSPQQDGAQQPAQASATVQDIEASAQPVNGEERDITLPHDLSPWGMFMAADWVVKAVMIGLAFASLVTWTVWLAKSLELAGAKARLRSALHAILGSTSLEEASRKLGKRRDAAARLVHAAVEESRLSAGALDHADPSGLKERVWSRMSRIQIHTGRRLSRGTGVLATIGSTSPFVGLFGTVWGIMNSFIGISESQTTNLAVVAPGIAEALLATALGLVAAIPAVVIYNVFSRSITGYRQALADAAAGVERLVSRDLDFRKVPAAARERLAAE
ncbi:outer membrane transport energization protein ExbB [Aquamicrobium defluvii]|uniref:Biopolymer transport protein ExbB n=2 Tax=Aquamicrobium defluvii TaxID=69279 RepID=A0A4R6Y5K3_9HYPH|nr:outer membrane transport energization protein ExbB [Aquamicrobium defluvii]